MNPSRKQREISYTLCDFEADYAPIIKVDGTPLFTDEEMEVIDSYNSAKTEIAKNKSKAKVEAANKTLAEINEQVKALYQKALDYVKENSFDLVDECAFKEWDEQTAARVQAWIDTVAMMQDPVAGTVSNDVAAPAPATTTPDPIDDMMGMSSVTETKEEDLPF